jgi:hypothetical protein
MTHQETSLININSLVTLRAVTKENLREILKLESASL